MAGVGSFTLDPNGMQVALLGPGGPVVADLESRAIRVESAAKELCPVDTGLLRSSITHRIEFEGQVPVALIGTNIPYARWRHDGTGVYGPTGQPIRPTHATVLRWPTRATTSSRPSRIPTRARVITKSQTPTGFAFATEVQGTPGVPFLLDALPAAA